MKERICFIIQRYNNGGGTERVLSQIAGGLAKRGYSVSIISIDKGLEPTFETDKRVKLYQLEGAKTLKKNKIARRVSAISDIMITRKRLLRLALEINPQIAVAVDVVLYHYADYLRKRMGLKTVCWEHYCLDSRKGALIGYSRRLAVKYASLTVVISKGDLKSYKEKFKNAKNLKLIYNPLSAEKILENSADSKIVAAAGRLTYQKGFDMLLNAWSKVEKEASDWELRIYGDGEDRDSLLAQAESLGLKGVRFMGYSENLHREMQKASIFVLSSRYEGFGLVLAEAQAMGLPCVSFDCKEGPRELIDDGINGFLAEEGNEAELGNKLLRLIKNDHLRKNFAASAGKDLYRFDIERILDEWESVLEEIMRD